MDQVLASVDRMGAAAVCMEFCKAAPLRMGLRALGVVGAVDTSAGVGMV